MTELVNPLKIEGVIYSKAAMVKNFEVMNSKKKTTEFNSHFQDFQTSKLTLKKQLPMHCQNEHSKYYFVTYHNKSYTLNMDHTGRPEQMDFVSSLIPNEIFHLQDIWNILLRNLRYKH